jgi:hypothetical protein
MPATVTISIDLSNVSRGPDRSAERSIITGLLFRAANAIGGGHGAGEHTQPYDGVSGVLTWTYTPLNSD